MKRNRDTIRNPNNWIVDDRKDIYNSWANLAAGKDNGDILDADKDGSDYVKYKEEVEDIREVERRNYYSLVEQLAIQEEVSRANDQYYEGYKKIHLIIITLVITRFVELLMNTMGLLQVIMRTLVKPIMLMKNKSRAVIQS